MKIIIGCIISGLVGLSFSIWLPILSDTQYEITEKETIHPCQQVISEALDFAHTLSRFDRSSATLQQIIAFNEVYEELAEQKFKEFNQNIIKYNCGDTRSEWITEEFVEKMKFVADYGFLP